MASGGEVIQTVLEWHTPTETLPDKGRFLIVSAYPSDHTTGFYDPATDIWSLFGLEQYTAYTSEDVQMWAYWPESIP